MRHPFRTRLLLALATVAAVGFASGCSTTANDVASNDRSAAAVELQTPPETLIPGFDLPQVLATSADGKWLYVAQNDGTVTQVSTPDYQAKGSWNSGITVPLGIALSPDGSTVYMSNRTAGTVVRKRSDSGANLGSWSTGSGSAPTGIDLSPDGTLIYVPQNASAGTSADRLTVRAAATGAVQQTWQLTKGSRPRAASVSPDGRLAYVSLEGTGRIAILNTADGSEVGSIDVSGAGFSGPGYLSLSPKGDRLYVATANPSAVLVFDTNTRTVTEKWTEGLKSAFGLAVANCGQTVFVADWTNPGFVHGVSQPNQCTPSRVPGPPLSVTAVFDNKSDVITVTWKPPTDTGSSAITRYTATASDRNKKTPDVSCTGAGESTLTCNIQVGNPGPRYDVSVTATNDAGTGAASPPVDVKTK